MSETKLLTLRDVPVELVHEARRLTGKGTGSQAFIASVSQLSNLTERFHDQENLIRKLKEDLQRSRYLLRQLAPLCVQVAEMSGQTDMFD
jgi:hypothetical protein